MKVMIIKNSGDVIDVTEITGEFSIKGSAKECARVLEIPLIRKTDYYLPDVKAELGDVVEIYDDDKGKKIDIFKGVVWEINLEDNDTDQQLTVYDYAIYLNKSYPKTQVYTDKTAKDVSTAIIKEMGLKVGDLAQGEKETYNGRDMTAYDLIMHTYTKAHKKNGKQYKLMAKGEEIHVFESGEKYPIVLEELDEPVVGKLLNTSYRQSLDDMVNKVEVVDEKKQDEKQDEEEKKESQDQYGVVQKVIRGEKADIKGTMKDAKIEATVEVIADWNMVTGMNVQLKSKVLEGDFYIISDDHTYLNGIHKATFKLSTEFEMDMKEEAQQQDDLNGFQSGPAGPRIEGALAWAHQQIGTKYSQKLRMRPGYFDCSSFALAYGKKLGALPAGYNWWTGSIPSSPYVVEVPRSQARRGDLLCWPGKHVEIYLGGGKIIHSTPPRLKTGNAPSNRAYRCFRFKGV